MAGDQGAKVNRPTQYSKDVNDSTARITSNCGAKQTNTDHRLRVASDDKTGPSLLNDPFRREIHHINYERILERVVHARGNATFGKFKLFDSAEDVSSADVLTNTSREPAVSLRFSTALGSRGSADIVRNVRGFAIKFYTQESAIKFPDVIRVGKPVPYNEAPQAQTVHKNFWYIQYMMQGFGERHLVKFIFTSELAKIPISIATTFGMAIENRAYRKWKFRIQPEELVPITIRYIGELQLSRNPDEYFTEVEQVAFCRNFSYFDTQISRLGTNWQELLINKLVCPVINHNWDGAMRHTITNGTVNYWLNKFKAKVAGMKVRMKSKFKEHIDQAQLFYNSLSPPEQAHVVAARSFEFGHCDDPIVYNRLCERFSEIDFGMSQQTEAMPKQPTIATHCVAITIADGYDSIAYNGVKAVLTAAGALPFTIGPRRSPIFAEGESRSDSKGVCKAFDHPKAIGATGEDVTFVRDARQLPGVAFSNSGEVVDSYRVVAASHIRSESFKVTVKMTNGAKGFN
ncbi:heme-dependent catalase [Lepidopterella palustris CBS 459.81]|uniref:catalase n=1 Tax=Lepidopterella palustris CBS 459.81 TaxID=1314670 RepID=A0A8E2EKG0_9PEZI|nr:heme-dependent catalase [Lepidopterella palustris CBS 459.81]